MGSLPSILGVLLFLSCCHGIQQADSPHRSPATYAMSDEWGTMPVGRLTASFPAPPPLDTNGYRTLSSFLGASLTSSPLSSLLSSSSPRFQSLHGPSSSSSAPPQPPTTGQRAPSGKQQASSGGGKQQGGDRPVPVRSSSGQGSDNAPPTGDASAAQRELQQLTGPSTAAGTAGCPCALKNPKRVAQLQEQLKASGRTAADCDCAEELSEEERKADDAQLAQQQREGMERHFSRNTNEKPFQQSSEGEENSNEGGGSSKTTTRRRVTTQRADVDDMEPGPGVAPEHEDEHSPDSDDSDADSGGKQQKQDGGNDNGDQDGDSSGAPPVPRLGAHASDVDDGANTATDGHVVRAGDETWGIRNRVRINVNYGQGGYKPLPVPWCTNPRCSGAKRKPGQLPALPPGYSKWTGASAPPGSPPPTNDAAAAGQQGRRRGSPSSSAAAPSSSAAADSDADFSTTSASTSAESDSDTPPAGSMGLSPASPDKLFGSSGPALPPGYMFSGSDSDEPGSSTNTPPPPPKSRSSRRGSEDYSGAGPIKKMSSMKNQQKQSKSSSSSRQLSSPTEDDVAILQKVPPLPAGTSGAFSTDEKQAKKNKQLKKTQKKSKVDAEEHGGKDGGAGGSGDEHDEDDGGLLKSMMSSSDVPAEPKVPPPSSDTAATDKANLPMVAKTVWRIMTRKVKKKKPEISNDQIESGLLP